MKTDSNKCVVDLSPRFVVIATKGSENLVTYYPDIFEALSAVTKFKALGYRAKAQPNSRLELVGKRDEQTKQIVDLRRKIV